MPDRARPEANAGGPHRTPYDHIAPPDNRPSQLLADRGQMDVVRVAASLMIAALLMAMLYLGQGVLLPLAIAFLISFALSPLVNALVRMGLPRIASVMVVMTCVFIFLAGLSLLVGTQVRSLAQELPTYQETIRSKLSDLRGQFSGPGVFDGAFETVDTVQEEIEVTSAEKDPEVQKVEIQEPPPSPLDMALAWISPALGPLAEAGIVLVFVFLVLLDHGDLRDRLIRLMGGNLHRSTDAIEEAGRRISKYLLMQLIVNVTYGIPIAAGLYFIGVPGWLLWGTLAALMRFIPYVGPMLAAICPLALAFAVDPGWNMVLWTLALILVLELVSNNIVEPLLYGSSTGLSAIALIAAATFWTALWGPVGLILSTPLTVCLLVIGRNLPQLQFLETLLGSAPVLDPPTRIYQRLIADDPQEALEIAEDVIEDQDIIGFYDSCGLEVLRRVSRDHNASASAAHRLRVANGMDTMLEGLREDHPATTPLFSAQEVACIGGKWEIDSVATEMLVHALAFEGIEGRQKREGALSARYIAKLELEGYKIVCISYFSATPEASARSLCRRLRQRWPDLQIVLGLWNAPPALLQPGAAEALFADEIVTSLQEAAARIHAMITPKAAQRRQFADPPRSDEARVAALTALQVLKGHAREELDALAMRAADVFDVRMAMISALDGSQEFIIGQNIELPGKRTTDGTDMVVMPRRDAICDHVVAKGEMLVVDDTERDPRFTDHPAILQWKARFYAGAPLVTPEGLTLGALCLLDPKPRELSPEDQELLTALAADVVLLMTGEARAASDTPTLAPTLAPNAKALAADKPSKAAPD